MKGHVFKTATAWGVYTPSGDLFESKFPTEISEGIAGPSTGGWKHDPPGGTGTSLTLNVSHSCNLRCVYCYAGGGSYGADEGLMAPEVARQAVRSMAAAFERPLREVKFFGGEPLLNIDAIEAAIDEAGILFGQDHLPKFGVVTNGTLAARSPRFIELAKKYGFAATVSIDGPREIHDALRPRLGGQESYSEATRGLRTLVSELGSTRVKCEATFTRLHQQKGFSRIDVVEHINSLGVPVCLVMDYLGTDEGLKCLDDEEEVEAFQDRMLNGLAAPTMSTDFGISDLLGSLVSRRYTDYTCPVGESNYLVSPLGNIYPCNLFLYPQFKMGSIFDPKWNESAQCRQVRTTLAPAINRSGWAECRECWNYQVCGGCPASLFHLTGELRAPDSMLCERKRRFSEKAFRWLLEVSAEPEKWRTVKRNLSMICKLTDLLQK